MMSLAKISWKMYSAFFCVKMEQTNRIFELSKRRFNAPAHSVKLLELCRRKSIRIEICHNGFICGICNFEADKAKRQFVKLGGYMFPVFFWQVVKGPIIGNQFILISVFEKILHLICLLCSQRKLYNAEAVTRSVRQPNCFMSSVVRLPPSIHSNVTIIFSKGSFLFLLKFRDGSLENSHGTSLI